MNEAWWREQAAELRLILRTLVDSATAAALDQRIARALALPYGDATAALRAALRPHPAVWSWLRQRHTVVPGARHPNLRLGTAQEQQTGRYLAADVPSRIPPGMELPLQVAILREAGDYLAARTDPFAVPAGGVDVEIIVAGDLAPLDSPTRIVRVTPDADSHWVRFRLEVPIAGIHRLRIRAFVAGTSIAELTLVVEADARGSVVTKDRRQGGIGSFQANPGEVTLSVGRIGEWHHVKLVGAGADDAEWTGRLDGAGVGLAPGVRESLNQLARKRGPFSDQALILNRLKQYGIELWDRLMPPVIQRGLWRMLPRMTVLSLATDLDTVPWELMRPVGAGQPDRGFLADLVPVVRRVNAQGHVRSLNLTDRVYVVPAGATSPDDALIEMAEIRRLLGVKVNDHAPLTDLADLVPLIVQGDFGLLHFACHNLTDDGWPTVHLAGGPFQPIDLSEAVSLRALASRAPLVFFNACHSVTTGGTGADTARAAWAEPFMAAGAGAFVGSMWEVRSSTAQAFATRFYQELVNQRGLGAAALAARRAIKGTGDDPTWLAYAVYGDPAAVLSTEDASVR